MGQRPNPNFRARQLGRALRRLREQIGMSQREAATRLRYSVPKISRIEQGQVPEYHGLRAMLDLYGVIVSDWDEYLLMHERAQDKGWWHAYGMDGRGFISVEADACLVRTFDFGYVPGLLQTVDYMRQVFTAERRPLEGQLLDDAVTVRLRRQRRLVDEPQLRLHAIIDENALRRQVCPGAAHEAQLRKIVDQTELENVTVQVVSESIGTYPGQYGNLSLASFPDPVEPEVAYVEHILGSMLEERESRVSAARLAFEDLADRALDQEDSIALIERL
ncbi:helix-turn-helix domain-containing protein [Amycolatopsis nigrescens]|uniref:helix-turn-helix domain-containing protein n=1 Tax=Amycolatopsis nigrescens TaxID=381445 RepID=UPI00037E2A3C|nr:helix-turn-helix transcriptional regulator [Amycolatopsis nigrescens]